MQFSPSRFVFSSSTNEAASGCSIASVSRNGSKECIGAGGKHLDVFIRVNNAKQNVGSFRTTKPVLLKGFDVLGEVDALKTVLEFLSIDGEIEEPLAHFLLHHGPVTPPTAPRLDLFVRKYGGARSAPVHGRAREWRGRFP